ncbi:CFA47 protein, partial [Bucco capensis]|nr:CFA47 protein [Bucco capensis]
GIHLAAKGKLSIPVLFMAETMQKAEAVLVIRLRRENGENWHYEYSAELNKDLKSVVVGEDSQLQGILWIYPLCGIPEALQQKSVPAVLRCPARQRVERRVQVLLSASAPLPAIAKSQHEAQVTDGVSTTEEFLYELQYPSDEMKSQLDSVVGVDLAEREWDTASGTATLSFNVVFAPNKPMRSKATLRVQCTAGGVWSFPLLFIATKPKVEEVINIAALGLNKESLLAFKLTSQTR